MYLSNLLGSGATLPEQAGNAGKFVTTDGTDASWGTIPAPIPPSIIRSARTSNTMLVVNDSMKLIDITSGTFTQTFDAAATLGSGWYCYLRNSGTGDITLDPNAAELIDGLAGYMMYPGECRLIQCDGVGFNSVVLKGGSKTYLTSGSFVKPPNVDNFVVDIISGGGGGAAGRFGTSTVDGGGGGGGGGRIIRNILGALLPSSVAVTVGAGGLGGQTDGASGSNGGTTSFGPVYVFGGQGSSGVSGGRGGGVAFTSTTPTYEIGGQGVTRSVPLIALSSASYYNTGALADLGGGGGSTPNYSLTDGYGGASLRGGSGGGSGRASSVSHTNATATPGGPIVTDNAVVYTSVLQRHSTVERCGGAGGSYPGLPVTLDACPWNIVYTFSEYFLNKYLYLSPSNPTKIIVSLDGTTFDSEITLPFTPRFLGNYANIFISRSAAVASGVVNDKVYFAYGNGFYYSSNLVDWIYSGDIVPLAESSLYMIKYVIYTGNSYLAIQSHYNNNPDSYDLIGFRVYRSTDLSNWVLVKTAGSYHCPVGVASNGSGTVVIRSDAYSSSMCYYYILKSIDYGVTWLANETVYSTENYSDHFEGVAYFGGKFLTVIAGAAYTSSTGSSWVFKYTTGFNTGQSNYCGYLKSNGTTCYMLISSTSGSNIYSSVNPDTAFTQTIPSPNTNYYKVGIVFGPSKVVVTTPAVNSAFFVKTTGSFVPVEVADFGVYSNRGGNGLLGGGGGGGYSTLNSLAMRKGNGGDGGNGKVVISW